MRRAAAVRRRGRALCPGRSVSLPLSLCLPLALSLASSIHVERWIRASRKVSTCSVTSVYSQKHSRQLSATLRLLAHAAVHATALPHPVPKGKK